MDAVVSKFENELSHTCATMLEDLRRAAEEELALGRKELKRREEALECREQALAAREVDVARRENALQAKSDGSSQPSLTLMPTPARAGAAPSPTPKAAGQLKEVSEDWGLSPLRSVREEPSQTAWNPESEALSSPLPSPAESSATEVTEPLASPARPKPRPAAVPALRLLPQVPAESPVLSPKEAEPVEVGRLKAMFECKAKVTDTPSKAERRTRGASSTIAAAASALQAASGSSPVEDAAPERQKLSLQELLRQDEERSRI
eukprot:TRINITY_DN2201_c0_g3_i1.p1 TRINITY_DN2201_c0_g3~~TRINITY_DN2201_c0_g3_i1.p1  ORF type:complete len:284 (+),score=67.25 TRINITY_DN2201_c0_g3_i1:65-853(+)